MAEFDPQLGKSIHAVLVAAELDSPNTRNIHDKELIRDRFTDIMQDGLGLDMMDPSLSGTPKRVAKMFCDEIFSGLDYNKFPACTTFPRQHDELILVDEIELKSMCEHHWMPFIGSCSVGYIPNKKVMGLSKFNRVVNFFARRPQIQEKLVEQISFALQFILDTQDVGVIIRAEHYCMKMRGVEDFCSNTVTSKMTGRFMSNPVLRDEFLKLSRVAK